MISGRVRSSFINATFVCCPPEKLPIGRRRSSSANPNRWNIVSISLRQEYPRIASICFCNLSYSRRSAPSGAVSFVSAAVFICSSSSFMRSSQVNTGTKTFFNSSSTVTSASTKLTCRRKPISCLPAIVMPHSSSLSKLLISISPAISLSRVVFPQPLRPTIAIFSLSCTSKLTSRRITSPPNCTRACLI